MLYKCLLNTCANCVAVRMRLGNYKIMNIASLSCNLYGHVYSALQYSYKIGICEVLYTFYFDITFFL